MPPELIHWLPRSTLYVVASVVAVTFVLSRLAEAFESVADLLGPPGRWIHRRYKARDKARQQQLDRSIRAAIEKAADYKALHRRIEWLEKQIIKLEAEITKLRLVEETNAAHQDMTAAYLREDAQWHIDAGTLAAELGFELLPHRSYSKFCAEYREKHGLDFGRRWGDEPQR